MSKGRLVKSTINSSNEDPSKLRKGPWTLEEDNLLIHHVTSLGEGHWNALAKCSGLKRTGKSCRLRWLNYLKPDVKRGNLSPQEQLLILELHFKWGNRWSKIAEHLPKRTDNEIKNYWRTRVEKQARQLKVDSNSREFLEAIRSIWIPRLLEKMEQCPSLLSSPPPSSCSTTTIGQNQNSTFSFPLTNQQESSKPKSPRFYSSKSTSMTENTTSFNGWYHSETNNNYFEESFMEQSEFLALVESQDISMSEYEVAEVDWFTNQVTGSIDEFL